MSKLKAIKFLSLVQAYRSLDALGYANVLTHYGIQISDDEMEDLGSLVDRLKTWDGKQYILDGFYVGYKIPQIGKEFDLVRIGENYIVNIELKQSSTEEKIKRQLLRNNYYLRAIGKPVYNWTYVSSEQQLYLFDLDAPLQQVDFPYLIRVLRDQVVSSVRSMDDLFNPSVYLVSPFNSTRKFVNDEYFLTQHQEEIKVKVIKSIAVASRSRFISISGSAGTGKTLLIYDIAKDIIQSGRNLIIAHCGNLNEGQKMLRDSYEWDIVSIKQLKSRIVSGFDVVIIDEAQRMYVEQFKEIVKTTQTISGNCIFAFDQQQTLANRETSRKMHERILAIKGIEVYRLSEKIRTNRELASFIKGLFDKTRPNQSPSSDNIELNYFSRVSDAKKYLKSIRNAGWVVLRFTPSQYDNEHHETYYSLEDKTSHGVIGQEFDNVAVVIDEFFSYSQTGRLIYKDKVYYHPVKMLSQNVTRTRNRLNVVVIGNAEILDRCVSLLEA